MGASEVDNPVIYTAGRTNFGLLPVAERSPVSFISSIAINGLCLALALYVGATAKKIIDDHKYEQTELIIPSTPPPEKAKIPEPPKIKPPDLPEVKFEAPKIYMPKPEPKPEEKPIQMEAKVTLPAIKAKPQVVTLAPQPKAALRAAMPAQDNRVKPSTAPVHLGQTFGVTPNPNATRPATIAAIGNPYGNMNGPAIAPHGVPGSTGIGNGTQVRVQHRSSGQSGLRRHSRRHRYGCNGWLHRRRKGGLGSAFPKSPKPVAVQQMVEAPTATSIEVISKPPSSTPRSQTVEGPGRRNAARYFHRLRPGGGARRGAWTGPWPG